MPHSVSDLLTRNLHDVFGEGDALRRRAAIADLFTEDAAFYGPDGVVRGRDAIDRVAGEIRATHPDYLYTVLGAPEDLHDAAGRVRWVSGRPGDAPAYAGTDFIVAHEGRIEAVYLFFDPCPSDCRTPARAPASSSPPLNK